MKLPRIKFSISRPDGWDEGQVLSFVTMYMGITKHKGFELQLYTGKFVPMADFEFSVRKEGDHPGVYLDATLLRTTLSLSLYDGRHAEDLKPKKERGE